MQVETRNVDNFEEKPHLVIAIDAELLVNDDVKQALKSLWSTISKHNDKGAQILDFDVLYEKTVDELNGSSVA